jgi:hypothetical protein
MTLQRELSLEDLLLDPIIRLVMARDGIAPEDIRHLMRNVVARAAETPPRQNATCHSACCPARLQMGRRRLAASATRRSPAVAHIASSLAALDTIYLRGFRMRSLMLIGKPTPTRRVANTELLRNAGSWAKSSQIYAGKRKSPSGRCCGKTRLRSLSACSEA